jgi:hypothetical protein
MNYNSPKTLDIMILNKNIIHQLPQRLFDIGAKIAKPYDSKGSPDRPYLR